MCNLPPTLEMLQKHEKYIDEQINNIENLSENRESAINELKLQIRHYSNDVRRYNEDNDYGPENKHFYKGKKFLDDIARLEGSHHSRPLRR